jgi:hypothetical protein
VQGEADTVAPESFLQGVVKIVDDSCCMRNESFNVVEMGLYWKKISSGPFIAKEEKTMPGFELAKDKLTLLLGANASGT